MAAKLGDKNPDNNPRLRLAILTARKNSMPNDNIKRAIEKASGANTESYEAVRYEGYGPGAVPVIVEALTDNPRRTVPEIRNIFGKNGGNMGEEGSVVFMFTRAGQIMYPASIGKTEDEMMEIIMDANADNLETSEEGFIITTKPEDFVNVQKYLSDVLGEPEQAELTWLPNMPMDLDDEAYAKLEKLVDALDANDDVQKVFTAAA
jgi:YebC/PmpR family DNA-binding regulatory protein